MGAQGSSVVRMAMDHSAVLQNFSPAVKKFSVSLTSSLGTSEDITAKVYDVITGTLAVQMDKLALLSNATSGLPPLPSDMCCQCNTCTRSHIMCSRSCCFQGSGDCLCQSCATGVEMTITSIDDTMTSPHRMWAVATQEALMAELRTLVAGNVDDAIQMCCSCGKCTKRCRACGKSCCCKGTNRCRCTSCLNNNPLMEFESVTNPLTLTHEAEVAIQGVTGLVDHLLMLTAGI